MNRPSATLINVAGTNCNEEMAFAFERAGAEVDQIHMSELLDNRRLLASSQILAFAGGFSNGDYIAAGRVYGVDLKTQLADEVNEFLDRDGLALGVCNGFQILTESGILPYGDISPDKQKAVSLTANNNGKFEDRWGKLKVEQYSVCRFASQEILGETVQLPWANGEGRAAFTLEPDDYDYSGLMSGGQIVFRYTDNPNGSHYDVAGICDPTGSVLGLMPHPERAMLPTQHPDYHRAKARGEAVTMHGAILINAMVDQAKEI